MMNTKAVAESLMRTLKESAASGIPDGSVFVSLEEFEEILGTSKLKLRELFIAGYVNPSDNTLLLWKGDMVKITVPFSFFKVSGNGTAPNFSKLSIIDYGQTIKLGEYEAAGDAILYEYDAYYKIRADRNMAKPPGPSSYEPKVPKPLPNPLKGIREPGSSSYDASGRRKV